MLWNTSELIGYRVIAEHERVGKLYDFLFDNVEWRTRYLVVDIGPWIVKRLVVIEPGFAQQLNLPQVAVTGWTHLLVTKEVADGRTRTHIQPVADKSRVEEIARMLGGRDLTSVTLRHASEMLRQ